MSDENNNPSVGEETVPITKNATSSGGVFSWLSGSRSPAPGTSGANATTTTTSTSVQRNGSGSVSPSGTASPVGSGSPASGTRSPARSSTPPRSPARRVVAPNVAAGYYGVGGRFGSAVTMSISPRTTVKYDAAMGEGDSAATTTTYTTMTTGEIDEQELQQLEHQLPPSVQITTKTFSGDASTEQVPPQQHKTIGYVTSTTSDNNNQVEPGMMEQGGAANVQYISNTVAGPPQQNQQHGIRYVTSSTGGAPVALDGHSHGGSSVRYVTSTTGGSPVALDGQGGSSVRYVTSTSGGAPVGLDGQGGSSVRYVTSTTGGAPRVVDGETHRHDGGVRYITRTIGGAGGSSNGSSHSHSITPVASPVAMGGGATSVRYVTASPMGASGMHGGSASHMQFFPPQVQPPQVHTVTRVVNGQHVQVPVPAGEPHRQNVQYITRSVSPASHSVVSNASSASMASPVGASGRQQVRYITKTMGAPQTQNQTQTQIQSQTGQTLSQRQLQFVSGPGTVTVVNGATGSVSSSSSSPNGSGGGVALSTVVASTLSRTPNQSGASVAVELEDGVEGLPPTHFIGVQRTLADTDSSDGDDHEVKMVFDIMSQTFKPVGKRRSRRIVAASAGAAAAMAVATASDAATIADMETKAEAPEMVATEATAVGSGMAIIDTETHTEVEETNGAGIATAAAIGLTAVAAVGAVSAAVGAGAKSSSSSSPMRKLDTVASPSKGHAVAAAAASSSSPKKRTASQTKREPSPRAFFATTTTTTTASAAADEAQLLPDESVTLVDMEPQTQYAELRSPARNMTLNGDGALGHIGLLLQVRKCRWLLITLLSVAIMVVLMVVFYKGVTLRKYQSSEYSLSKQYDMADSYNGYVALVATLFSKPIELLVAVVLPIVFLTFIARSMLATALSSRLKIVLFVLSFVVSYLLMSGFHAINVQLRVQGSAPVIALSDLSLQLAASASLAVSAAANASSNASLAISESRVGNAITNTVLRNVIELAVDGMSSSASASALDTTSALNAASSSALLCSNTVASTRSGVSSKTVATYGFPMRAWQREMLPGAVAETNYTLRLDSTTTTPTVSTTDNSLSVTVETLPMRVRTAANLLLHSIHFARDAFRWVSSTTSPLGVQQAVITKYATATELTRVNVAELLELTTASSNGNVADDVVATPAFLKQARVLFNRSLESAANVSRSESSLEFTSVALPNGYTFESVTMELPLIKSFLTRRLARSTPSGPFAEDVTALANETTTTTSATTYYYDLDIAADCGPYAGSCEIRPTEYDAQGSVFEPTTGIRAFALCNNSQGNDDLEVRFDGSSKNVSYVCDGHVDSGMLIVSVATRIVGGALIEGPSPLVPRLVEGQATLVNARKIYSLTVGKLTWPTINLATTFHAACAAGPGMCSGLQYALTAALANATQTQQTSSSNLRGGVKTTTTTTTTTTSFSSSSSKSTQEDQFLVVGKDFLPLRLLRPFDYNATEAATTTTAATTNITKAASGYPLVSITKPLAVDSPLPTDGDVIVAANFKNVSWSQQTQRRSGASCSATVEARLNSVLNNHLYMERGVQPSYTAGLFFLFQDAVPKAQIELTSKLSTLRFANSIEFLELRASIPLLNVVLTLIGCAMIVLAALYVAVCSSPKRYTITNHTRDSGAASDVARDHVEPETLARVKLNHALYPPVVLHRNIVDLVGSGSHDGSGATGASKSSGPAGASSASGRRSTVDGETVDAFEIQTTRMEQNRGELSVQVPYATK